MNAKILIVVALLVVIGALAWLTLQTQTQTPQAQDTTQNNVENTPSGDTTPTTGTQTQNTVTPAEMHATFVCEDNASFIVSFPDANTGDVIVNGTLVGTVKREGDTQRFENEAYAYVFAGEGLTLTNKLDDTSVSCTQPVDPDNAPMNFGDAA